MQKNRDWSWVDKDGIEHPVDEDELAFSLSSEVLAPYTLVSHRSWAGWLPAFQVAELAWALPPGYADTPQRPQLSESGARTPPPLDRYPELETRARNIKDGFIHPALESVSNLSGAAAVVEARSSFRTISDDDVDELTVQLNSAEVERALAAIDQGADKAALSQPVPQAPLSGPKAPSASRPKAPPPSRPNAPPPSAPEAEIPEVQIPRPPPVMRLTPPATQSARASSPVLADIRNTAYDSIPPPPRRGLLLPALVVCLVAGAGWLAYSQWLRPVEATKPTQIPVPSAAPTPASLAPNCSISAGPERVAEWAQPGIRPIAALTANPTRVKVGFAKTTRQAYGQEIDTETLEVYEPFTEVGSSPLSSVVPFTHTGSTPFGVSRAATTLQSQVLIDARVPFPVGLNQQGLATKAGSTDTQLWPSKFENISVPSVATQRDGSFVLAFRAGGERGELTLGLLTPSGVPRGNLSVVRVPAERLGVPSVTSSDTQLLVALDGDTSATSRAESGVFVAVSTFPKLPTEAKRLSSSDPTATSPVAVALKDDHLLVQWTTGAVGRQQIVAQVYDSALAAVSAPITLSPSAKDAHSAVTVFNGERALSVYMVRSGENHELWATSLSCK